MKTQGKKHLVFKKKNIVELSKTDQVNVIGGSGVDCYDNTNNTSPTRFTKPFCNAVLIN